MSLHKEISFRTAICQHPGTLHTVAEEQAIYRP